MTKGKRIEKIDRNLELLFVYEKEDGEILDTDVFINNNYIYTIAGGSIDEFIKEFKQLNDKYRI